MFKKTAITAILLALFLAGSLIANDPPIEPNPLIIHVVAQEEVDWTLKIWDGIQSPWIIHWNGTKDINAVNCQGCPYEMWALDETIFIESGNLPFTDWFEIVIPITVPSHKDPQQ